MKKFTKIMMSIAAVCLTVGVGLSASGIAMGASLDDLKAVEELKENYQKLKAEVRDHDWDDDDWDDDDWHDHEQSSSGGASYSSGRGDGTYDFSSIDEIEVELKYDTFIVEEYDGNTVQVVVENDPDGDIAVWNEGLELKIEGRNTKQDNRNITLYLPEDTNLLKFSVEVDQGEVEISDDVNADEIDIQIGAGQFTNDGALIAREFEAEVGVGNAEISHITASSISAECGTGSMQLGVTGTQEEYSYKLECKLGAIIIGNDTYSSLNREEVIKNQDATGIMELECGLGEMTVEFE